MPYSKIRLTATGAVRSSVACDLETGWVTTLGDPVVRRYAASFSKYEALQLSPSLLERRAFEIISDRFSDRFSSEGLRKKMRKCTRDELFKLANDANLNPREPDFGWPYRDGWSVWVTLNGPGVPSKALGPFSFIDEGSKIERMIGLASEDGSLFFGG